MYLNKTGIYRFVLTFTASFSDLGPCAHKDRKFTFAAWFARGLRVLATVARSATKLLSQAFAS